MSVFSDDENNTPKSQRDAPVGGGGSLLKRDQQKPGILAAKNLAAALGNKSKSLERIAKGSGWENWSTMHAALSRPGLPWPAHCPKMAALHERFGLDSQDPDVVIQKTTDIFFEVSPAPARGDMWQRRALLFFDASVRGCFDHHRVHNVQVGILALSAVMTFQGPSLPFFVRGYLMGHIDGPGRDRVMAIAQGIPAWSNERALRGESQLPKVKEQMGYLIMQFSRTLDLMHILDDPY